MVKTVTLAFCSIQYHFIRNIRVKFGIHKSPQSRDIGQTSEEVICNFRIFGQSLITKNCQNSRTRHDIEMKLGPVTNFNERIMATSRKFDDDVISTNYIFFQVMPDFQPSGSQILELCSIKFTFSLTITFFITNLKTKIKNLSREAVLLLIWIKVQFLTKMMIFCIKLVTSAKLKLKWY